MMKGVHSSHHNIILESAKTYWILIFLRLNEKAVKILRKINHFISFYFFKYKRVFNNLILAFELFRVSGEFTVFFQ